MSRKKSLIVCFLISCFAVFYLLINSAISNFNGDILMAFPIAKEAAQPGLYSPYDLLVSSGMRGPFHLYKLAGILYRYHIDVEVIWFILTLFFVFLTFFAFWQLAHTLTDDLSIASFTTMLFALAPPSFGTLNWTFLPTTTLVTSLVAIPFELFALILFLKKRYFFALILAGITFNIHPSALILLVSISIYLFLFTSNIRLSSKLFWVGIGFILALPNGLYTISSLPNNFTSVASSASEFYRLFRIHAYHVFIEDHFQEGYGWFFLNLGGTFFFLRYFTLDLRRRVKLFIGILLVILGVYIFNLYVIKYPALLMLLLFRVTYFIKPVMFIVVTYGVWHWFDNIRRKNLFYLSGGLIVMAVFILSFLQATVSLSEVFLLGAYTLLFLLNGVSTHERKYFYIAFIALFIFLLEVTIRTLAFVNIINFQPLWTDYLIGLKVFLGIGMLLFFFPERFWKNQKQNLLIGKDVYKRKLFFSRITLLFIFLIILKNRNVALQFFKHPLLSLSPKIYFSQPKSLDSAKLIKWVKANTRRGSLFLLPPLDQTAPVYVFLQFRVASERGVYALEHEINQLSYDTSVYSEGQRRLEKIGFKVIGRHQFDVSGYYRLSITDLKNLHSEEHIDYAIFEKGKLNKIEQFYPIYESEQFVVIDLNKL